MLSMSKKFEEILYFAENLSNQKFMDFTPEF